MGQITLKAARVNAGFKLDEVGSMIGRDPKTVSNWERGVTAIPTIEFNNLCRLYDMGSDYIKVPIVNDGIFSE